MPEPEKKLYISLEQYFEIEETSPVRHEYFNGQIHAMTGASGNHREICANIYSALRAHLKGSHCRVSMNDAAVFIETGNCVYYPDVVVSCGKFLPNSNLVEEPVFIVEVLSTSTAATDRREKLLNYTSLKSLKEYLIIHQKFKRLELYRRTAAGSWEAFDYKDGELELLSMPSGPLKVSIDLIYENAEGVKNWKVLEETPPYTFEYYEQEGVFGW